MIEPIISQLTGDFSTVILLVLIIIAFIIAYKVMAMVFQTLLVTGLSAGFYVTLSYLFEGFAFSLRSMLFYALLGASLYMGFKFLASAYRIGELVISVPYKAIKLALKPIFFVIGKISGDGVKERVKNVKEKKSTGESESSESSNGDAKEVVLDKLTKDDEE